MGIPVAFRQTKLATPGGSTIAVYESGSEGPRVFVVGGMSGVPVADSPLGEALAAAPVRATMMDIASSGESRFPGLLTMETWLKDVEHVFVARVGEPASWIGASVGAWLMMLIHSRHPEWFTRMCALAPAFDWGAVHILPGLRSGALTVSGTNIMRGATPLAPSALIASMSAHSVLNTRTALHAPLHVLIGGKDDVAPAEPIKRFLQSTSGAACTAEFFPEGDHGVAKLAGEGVRLRFENWLRDTSSAPRSR